ncbi:MFS transporter [Chloroflexota bacterium]
MLDKTIKKLNLRPYLSGLLPLFLLAHFGHHVFPSILRPLMPMIRTDLGLSYTQSGFTMSAFSVTAGISHLLSGWLADRFGSRLMVLLSITGVAIAGLLIGLSHSYMALIIFLVVAAIMAGGYHPAASATVSMLAPPEYRGRTLAIHEICGSSAFWMIPLLVAPIATAWGWRGSYITLTIPTIMLGILLYILLGRQRQSHVGEFLKPDNEVPTESAGVPWRKIGPFIIISITTTIAIRSVSAFLSLYAVDSLGLSEATAAMLMAVSPAVTLFAAPLGGYLSDRFGSMPMLLIISFLAIPFIYLLGIASSAQALAALMVALGIASGSRMPASESYIASNTPNRCRATVLGLYFFGITEGSGLLTPVMGTLIDQFGFYFCFTITSAATTAVLTVCSLFLWRNRK